MLPPTMDTHFVNLQGAKTKLWSYRSSNFKSFPRCSGKTTEMHGSLLTAEDRSKRTHLLHDPKRTSLKRQATQKKCNKFYFANAHTLEAERTVAENAERRVRTTCKLYL